MIDRPQLKSEPRFAPYKPSRGGGGRAWASRGEAYERLGQLENAAADYQQAISIFPQPQYIVRESWYKLANLLERQKRYCEAMVPVRTYVSFEPAGRRTPQIDSTLNRLSRLGNCPVPAGARAELRFPPDTKVILATVEVNGVAGRFVVDTGASMVLLSHAFSRRAGVDSTKGISLEAATANGTIKVILVKAEKIALQELSVRNVPVAVLPDGAPGYLVFSTAR